MADMIFNISKGMFKYYAGLPATNDAIIVVPIETAGIVADAAMNDYDDLAALLAGTSNEQTALGRKTISSILAITIDDTANTLNIDAPDQTWVGTTGNPVSALVWCYDPDTTGGTDSTIIPISKHDFVFTPDGTDVTAVVNALGLLSAT